MPASGFSMSAHTGTHTQQINYKREEERREGRKERRKSGKRKAKCSKLDKKQMVKTLKELSQINHFIEFEYSLHPI